MKTSLIKFQALFNSIKSNLSEYNKRNNAINYFQENDKFDYWDNFFYNSTLWILWKNKNAHSLENKLTEVAHTPIEIQEDFENGVWRYSFEYSDNFYFTVDSKEQIILPWS